MRQETDYVPHHIQKSGAFFQSMRNLLIHLKEGWSTKSCTSHRSVRKKSPKTSGKMITKKLVKKEGF